MKDKNKWVLCRVYENSEDGENDEGRSSAELSWMDQVFMSTLDDEEEEISFP